MAIPGDKRGLECKFVMPPRKKPAQRALPKVRDLNTSLAPTVPAPEYVVSKLLPCEKMVAIDVETHELVPKEGSLVPWSRDQFGLQSKTTASILSTLRAIQLGWAVGSSVEDMVVKSVMVRPDGFRVSPEATRKHGIRHEKLESDGVPLGEALRMMATDVLKHWSNGARVVSRNLPVDAGLIYEELCRAGLFQLQTDWVDAIRGGICTIGPPSVAGHEAWLAFKTSLVPLQWGSRL